MSPQAPSRTVIGPPTGFPGFGLSELWTGPGRTSAKDGELLVSVRVPALPARSGSAYVRLEYRRAMEIAVVGAAAAVTLNGDGDVEACRVERRSQGGVIGGRSGLLRCGAGVGQGEAGGLHAFQRRLLALPLGVDLV